ncbi:MAG: lysophospholipase [Bacteroidota bacterium]|nr:lysophospholipase [Bacteroidota bacterium]
MNKQKISFHHTSGTVEGIYINAGNNSPLVIIINGHNGFYNYGMFPYIQQKFFENGISSYSFNFSHGGVIGDADVFEDLEKYEHNCMRLETEDLISVSQNLKSKEFKYHSKVFLLAHSLGGVPTIFGAKKAKEKNIKIDGIILVSTVKTLNFWPSEMIKEWAMAGVYYKKNNRTGQELPQGFEFLQEIIKCDKEWNVQQTISTLKLPVLIIHGENDEAVPKEHAESLFNCIKNSNANAKFKIIPNATHTYNTKHPFNKTSEELEELIKLSVNWIYKLLSLK